MTRNDRDDGPSGASCPEMMALLKAGHGDAAREVHDRWSRQLIALARARLGRSIVAKEDAEDVVQSVYRTFFRRVGEGSFRVERWSEIWGLLAKIASRKCSRRRRLYQAVRRDHRRETSLASYELASTQPTAEDAALLSEAVDRLVEGMMEAERSIVLLSLQGYSPAEISTEVKRSERTVQRVRKLVGARLRRWIDADPPRANA